MLLAPILVAFALGAARENPAVSVVDSRSGNPLAGAAVTLAGENRLVHQGETDSEGYAEFPGLPPSPYLLHVEKPGYVDILDAHGRGRPVVFSAAGRPLSIGLFQAVAITGQALDFQGRPLQGAKVMAIVRREFDGGFRLTPIGEAARTDDRGHYRLYGLPAGHYSVAVVPAGDEVFAPAFYGSDGAGEAVFFQVQPGETRGSVNLRAAGLGAPSISGKVSGIPIEAGPHRAALMLVTEGGLRAPIAAGVTDGDGAFAMPHVPPGRYRLIAWAPFTGWDSNGPPKGTNARAVSRAVSVSAGDLQIDMELKPLASVSGRVVRDGVQDAARAAAARSFSIPRTPGSASGRRRLR